jgi:hypothetical protein
MKAHYQVRANPERVHQEPVVMIGNLNAKHIHLDKLEQEKHTDFTPDALANLPSEPLAIESVSVHYTFVQPHSVTYTPAEPVAIAGRTQQELAELAIGLIDAERKKPDAPKDPEVPLDSIIIHMMRARELAPSK